MNNRKRLFRFGLKSLLVVLTLACVIVAWLVNRIPHCRTVEKLQQLKVHITWQREEPSWLDKKLGPWRLDRIQYLHYLGGPPLDLTVVEDLNFLGGFGTHEAFVTNHDSLLKHAATIKRIYLDSPPQNATDFYAKFPVLEEIGVFAPVDFSRLQHLNLKSINNYGVRDLDIDAISKFSNLELLNLSCSNIESTGKLAGLKKLQTLSLNSCQQLKDLQGLDQLPALKVLELDDVGTVAHADVIGRCVNLEELTVPGGVKLESLTGLTKLKILYPLRGLFEPDQLHLLGDFRCLREMRINWSRNPKFDGVELDLTLLKEKPDLEVLIACRVTHLEHLARFPNLQKLYLSDSVITDADIILSLKRLKTVILTDCRMSDDVFDALHSESGNWEIFRITLAEE